MKLSSILVATAALAGTSSAYRLSVYSSDNYQGTQRTYTTSGSRSVGFTVKSWIWESTLGDGCCVNFCKGSTSQGRFCGSARKAVSSAGVNKVVTGCGNAVLNC
ncbi:hypothetical protein QBC42DRAFT_342313 [Cladorrhinum samala]|uniref:Uncharacterized protein n=1 Tax=Cladorrhinum samala TaxID=585594 RepID=A0AAV9H6Z9_9PEZI|nr:hypothetical protein QBC42DRAFT_342313 [Cladorrhinum samala]